MGINANFREQVEKGLGCAVIMMGSGSDDKPKIKDTPSHIETIAVSLEKFGIPYEVRVCSAHKQPGDLESHIKEYSELNGPLAIVAVAGGRNALSGTASFLGAHPVFSCPPPGPNDASISNPPGSCDAYVPNPSNVGKIIAQMYSSINPKYKSKIMELNATKIESLKAQDVEKQTKYAERQEGDSNE